MTYLELRGFRTDLGCILLTLTHAAPSGNNYDVISAPTTSPRVLERDLADFQSWDRQLHSNIIGHCRLPTKRLRKLMTCDWMRGECAAGWRVELLKSVQICEDWLNIAFAQLPIPQQQEFLNDGLYFMAKSKRMTVREEQKNARDLQQYFSSKELVDQVLKLVMEQLLVEQYQDVVWLEPSCGDGRFLTALLRKGAQHVVGYEIDERLQRIAENNVKQTARNVAWPEKRKLQAQVNVGDFLASNSSISVEKSVVVVGNPPFGARGDDKRDLVHCFFQHAALVWRARIIAFVVPKRCSRPEFVKTTLQLLRGDDNAGTIWKLLKEMPLPDYRFEFNTSDQIKRVRQPSVLQLFVCRTQ
ncbi:N6 adenine-specific DNA methyltransferase, N12 class [Plasmopara halstedii]|uniref:N6 adenine-specific DNA methyltransferase, N12 class n=1 Tax=Plasmopara halstedii TaxID=4781 RepID=A0A0P1AEJ7_PLAHL|nr:N6 adenine-specific DNA methyltransferase, N12 class [Plasmopara halstedii]CEG39223.1 N6 adenine-specific DNA methyltransferase, N12 class [Plasmopara halstedii]|eukprot:XP_024575592.1 N6 adenine-specific DNA methyltransferase, N12 class [Plasmopara halstedii]